MTKKILAPTDLSEFSRTGVRHALEMACSQGAEVIVYYVTQYSDVFHDKFALDMELRPVEELLQESRGLLTRFIRETFVEVAPKAPVHQEVEIGAPSEKILQKAVAEGADLIVMSTHGRTGVLHTPAGSVTQRVVEHAFCPVLTVRPTKEAKPAEAQAQLHKDTERKR